MKYNINKYANVYKLYYLIYAEKYLNAVKEEQYDINRCKKCPYQNKNRFINCYDVYTKILKLPDSSCRDGKLKKYLLNALSGEIE